MKDDNELITMGMNLGLYTFAKLFSEGVAPTPKSWEIMRDHCAKQLEGQTGLPIEDLALKVQPIVDNMLERVGFFK
jgi:hypothetical protein